MYSSKLLHCLTERFTGLLGSIFVFIAIFSACGDATLTSTMSGTICDRLRCEEPKECALVNDSPRCICPRGLYDDGRGDCLNAPLSPPLDPCHEINCPDPQVCALVDREAQCICPSGQRLTALNECVNKTDMTIMEAGGADSGSNHDFGDDLDMGIEADLGFDVDADLVSDMELDLDLDLSIDADMEFELDIGVNLDMNSDMELDPNFNPCEPNPCVEPNRGECLVDGESALCLCDGDFIYNDLSAMCEPPPPQGFCPNSHFDGDIYEPNECFSEASRILPDTSQNHSIEPAGDHDWLSFRAQAGHVYRFEVERDTLPNAIVSLYAQGGQRRIFAQSSTYEITHEFEEAGTYFYQVTAYNNRTSGDYIAHLYDLGLDDHADQSNGATLLEINALPTSGNIETRGDDDWFAFEGVMSESYFIELSRETISNAYIYLYRPDGVRIAEAHSTPESITYTLDESGIWFVRIRHNSSLTGTYRIRVYRLATK